MSVYRDKQRGGAWIFEFDRTLPNGERVRARKRLPKTWTAAEADEFDRTEGASLYAEAVLAADGSRYSIESAIASYIEERVPKLKTGEEIAKELANMYYLYAGKTFADLPAVCKAIKAMKRTKGDTTKPLEPATLRNRLRYLTAACRWAWQEHQVCKHDPAAGIKMPQVNNERHRYLTREEMLKAARACTNHKARMGIRIAFYSGLRLDEMFRAKVVKDEWQLKDTKNGDPRHIPINPKVAVCARQFPKLKGALITCQTNFRKALARVGLEDVHWHDLRHSTASELVKNKVDLFTTGRILGHKDPRSTARYSHLATDSLAEALNTMGRKKKRS